MPTKEKHFGDLTEWQWAMEDPRINNPMYTSSYYVDGIIFDTGAPASEAEFKKWCTSIGKENTTACILTHAHEDHAGGANWLQNDWHIPVYSTAAAAKMLVNGYSYPQYRQFAWGPALLPVKTQVFGETITTATNKFHFEIMPTPGHAPCQVAFLERKQGWLIVADAVQQIYKMLFGGTSSIQEDIHTIYNSITKLYTWTENVANLQIFTAGHDMIPKREFLKEKLDEIEVMHRRAHELTKQGLNEKKMLKDMFKGESFIGSMTNGEFSRANLLRSLLKWELQ